MKKKINNPSDYSDLVDLDRMDGNVNMVDPFIFNDTDDEETHLERRLSAIEKRLKILEPRHELLDKYEVLQSIYEQYKAAEAMLMGPDPEDKK